MSGDAEGRRHVAEQKAELASEGYRDLRLTAASQINHHRGGRALTWLLEAARDPARRAVKVGRSPVAVDGALLVWGATTPEGRGDAMKEYGLADVLSVEAMRADLFDGLL